MSSKREEERNEKIIRGLLKLPPNRRCINCNSLGPQYVCTNFWTFVCTACSGIHREFTHRVKSVSMAKFTTQEVESLQNGGNQRARELFLKDWDMQSMKFPDSSYPDKIREFIKNVYVNKKYAGGRSSDKPPKDPQGLKTYEEHRRASSYHSFSQSPPYDHQYEDRRYGRQGVMLTRKPGSDHGHYERNISSILYSPGRGREHIFEDRFANGNSGSRISNFSDPSTGDPSRSGGQSPNTYISSPSKQISSSSENFGSFDGNSIQPKSTKSGVLPCQVSGPEHTFLSQLPKKSTIPSAETSTSQNAASQALYRQQFLQQQNTKTIPVDFFADFSNQASFPSPAGNEPSSVPALENEGWAVFDSVNRVAPIAQPNKSLSSGSHPRVEGSIDIIDSSLPNQDNSQWLSAQNSASHGASISTEDQWHAVFNENQDTADSKGLPQLGHRHELMKPNGDDSSWFLAQNSTAYWPSESTANQWHASYKEIQNAAESRGSPQLMGHQHEPMRSNQDNSQWFSAQNSAAHGAPISTADPWYAGFNEIENVAGSRSLPVWNDFSDSVDGNPQALCLKSSESHFLVPNEDALQVPLVIDESTGSQPSDALTYEVRTTQGWKSSNPFDAPYDMEPGASNMFDVSSLQSAMPNAQLPNEFLDSFSQPWFQQKSASTFMPSIPQSGLPYMGGQVPSSQFPNIPSQGSVASGNPFA